MKNKIVVSLPQISKNRIDYYFYLEGGVKKAFSEEMHMFVEYNCDVSNIPISIAVIPLLTNIFPIVWLYDAELVVPICDKDFYESVESFKQGYINMYPMLEFKGTMSVGAIKENHIFEKGRSVAFYSGGVDATDMLIRHILEKPLLLSIWGLNILLEDEPGWNNILVQLKNIQKEYSLNFITVKSNFRTFINVPQLNQLVDVTKTLWFYGFQNGIGILGLAAPVAYLNGISTVYIASTNIDERCSSVPSIDGEVRYCGAKVVHDASGLMRQEKIHNIITDAREKHRRVLLNVCWTKNKPNGTINCCKCAKCLQTMLGIYAEGCDPKEYGFYYDEKDWKKSNLKMQYRLNENFNSGWLQYTLNTIHRNYTYNEVRDDLKWFFNMKPDDFETIDISECLLEPIAKKGYEKKVLVWSACYKTDKVVAELKKAGIDIYGYIDQKSGMMNTYNDHIVYDKNILQEDRFFVYVALDTVYYDVVEYLKKNDYVEYEDYFYPNS